MKYLIPIFALLLLACKPKSELPDMPASINNPICTEGFGQGNPKFTPEIFKQLGIVVYPEKGYWEAPIRQGTMKIRIPIIDLAPAPTFENMSPISQICDYGKGYQIESIFIGFNWHENQLWHNTQLIKQKKITYNEWFPHYSVNNIQKVELKGLSEPAVFINTEYENSIRKNNSIFDKNYYEPNHKLKHYPLIFYPKFTDNGFGFYGIENVIDDFTGLPTIVSCGMQQESLENLTQEKLDRLINRKLHPRYDYHFRFCTDYLNAQIQNQRFSAEIYLQTQLVEHIDKIYVGIHTQLKKIILPN